MKYALGSYVDVIPEYEQMNKPKELFFRYKANVCEMCGAYEPSVKVYQVKKYERPRCEHRMGSDYD